MKTIQGIHITVPDTLTGDGLNLSEKEFTVLLDSTIDLSSHPLSVIDECIGITRGAQGYFRNCTFSGSQKIALVGCGDKEWIEFEKGQIVVFDNCHFHSGARRMPEVQDGMKVLLLGCIIEDWCDPKRYLYNPKKNRGFGAWAHDEGEILAINCTFNQSSFWKGFKLMINDFLGHMGQTINDEGILGLFKPRNWIPGVCRGLFATEQGKVTAYNCKKNKWWIRIENHKRTNDTTKLIHEWLDNLSITNRLLIESYIRRS